MIIFVVEIRLACKDFVYLIILSLLDYFVFACLLYLGFEMNRMLLLIVNCLAYKLQMVSNDLEWVFDS